jgi:hypothetical protein
MLLDIIDVPARGIVIKFKSVARGAEAVTPNRFHAREHLLNDSRGIHVGETTEEHVVAFMLSHAPFRQEIHTSVVLSAN